MTQFKTALALLDLWALPWSPDRLRWAAHRLAVIGAILGIDVLEVELIDRCKFPLTRAIVDWYEGHGSPWRAEWAIRKIDLLTDGASHVG